MSTFRFRRAGGGSTLRGSDGLRETDAQTRSYVAAGGLVLGGAAVVAFIEGATAEPQFPQGHGVGPLELRTPSVPLPDFERRLTGRPIVYEHVAAGGLRYGGEAATRLRRYSVVYVITGAAGLRWSGKAAATSGNDDDDYLALAA